jgi:hypothetical protein
MSLRWRLVTSVAPGCMKRPPLVNEKDRTCRSMDIFKPVTLLCVNGL